MPDTMPIISVTVHDVETTKASHEKGPRKTNAVKAKTICTLKSYEGN